jgi:hypothetical protein
MLGLLFILSLALTACGDSELSEMDYADRRRFLEGFPKTDFPMLVWEIAPASVYALGSSTTESDDRWVMAEIVGERDSRYYPDGQRGLWLWTSDDAFFSANDVAREATYFPSTDARPTEEQYDALTEAVTDTYPTPPYHRTFP